MEAIGKLYKERTDDPLVTSHVAMQPCCPGGETVQSTGDNQKEEQQQKKTEWDPL